MITAEIKITLQNIIIYAQQQKERYLRGGAALPERPDPDEPILDNFINADVDHDRLSALSAAPVNMLEHGGNNDIDSLVLAVANNQIDIEEAINNATRSAAQADMAMPSASQTAEDIRQATPSVQAPPETNKKKSRVINPNSINERIREYLNARTMWRVEKARRRYMYDMSKKEIIDICVGYDDMIEYCQKLMHAWDEISGTQNVSYARFTNPTNFDFQNESDDGGGNR